MAKLLDERHYEVYTLLEFLPGTSIDDAAQTAWLYCLKNNRAPVQFRFNGKRFIVHHDTSPADIVTLYSSKPPPPPAPPPCRKIKEGVKIVTD